MSIAINSLSSINPSGAVTGIQSTGAAASSTKSAGGFASVLEGAIQSVEQPGQQADKAIQNFLNNVALTVQRASLAFDLGLQVRNKIVSAYQEVMKMQI
jgi:flagellar hook-basal body complex protein FliE